MVHPVYQVCNGNHSPCQKKNNPDGPPFVQCIYLLVPTVNLINLVRVHNFQLLSLKTSKNLGLRL